MFEDGIFMEDGLFTLSWVISQRVRRCGSEGNVISFSPETLSLSVDSVLSLQAPFTSLTLYFRFRTLMKRSSPLQHHGHDDQPEAEGGKNIFEIFFMTVPVIVPKTSRPCQNQVPRSFSTPIYSSSWLLNKI